MSLSSQCRRRFAFIQVSPTCSNIFTPIDIINLHDVEIKIEGNLHLPQNITYIQEIVKKTSGVWLTVQGTDVHITGTTNNASGWVECECSVFAEMRYIDC